MKNRFFYIGLNFVIPGMGQISAKRYLRGCLQCIGSIASIVWLAAEVILPFVNFYKGDIASNKLPEIKFISVLIPILVFVAILLWSIIDLLFGFKKTKIENNEIED
jgi:hypothetical protein